MHYEINVSLNGRHYFATDSRSLIIEADAEAMYKHFLTLFRKEDGYEVEMTYWITKGRRIHG